MLGISLWFIRRVVSVVPLTPRLYTALAKTGYIYEVRQVLYAWDITPGRVTQIEDDGRATLCHGGRELPVGAVSSASETRMALARIF